MKLIFILCAIAIVMTFSVIPFIEASHYIVGLVNNSLDGVSANGRSVILWNPTYGTNDNLTDIIGLNGNSGVDNLYMFDCELLDHPCDINDNLKISLLDNGDGRLTYDADAIVSGAGYDVANDLILNSPPQTSLIYPENNANLSSSLITFNCSGTDLDSNLKNITLYGNWSNGWNANETISITGNLSYANFSKQISEGKYIWNCLAYDNLSLSNFSSINRSFTVDRTPPVISSIKINSSNSCGTSAYVRVNCTVTDSLLNVNTVIIQATKPIGYQNYSTVKISNTYYADIPTDQFGQWSFQCIANDSVGNTAIETTGNYGVYNALADLVVNSSGINFSNPNPVENESVTINAVIYNNACGNANANNFLVGFYNGDPNYGGAQIGNNMTISIPGLNSTFVSMNFSALIGLSNIFVLADVNYTITEADETNNQANKSLYVSSWQKLYGNVSLSRLIASYNLNNMSSWGTISNVTGNIFVVDKDASIHWNLLQAIGMNTTGGNSYTDFSDIDALLGTNAYNDSVYNIFSDSGTPKETQSFTFFGSTIDFVPIINSSNNANFVTGILWDTFKDTDGKYGSTDREDLVFIANVNKQKMGSYGLCDYEINVPVKLRNYYSETNKDIYLYYDLE